MLLNMSCVIITEYPYISLSKSITPTRFIPVGTETVFVVSRMRKNISLLVLKDSNIFFKKSFINSFSIIKINLSSIYSIFWRHR